MGARRRDCRGAWGLWEPRHRIPRTHITFSVAHEYTGRRGPLFPVICAVYETVDVSGWSWITSLLVQNRFPKQSLVDAYFDVLTARMRRYAPRHHMYDKWKQVGMMSINLTTHDNDIAVSCLVSTKLQPHSAHTQTGIIQISGCNTA